MKDTNTIFDAIRDIAFQKSHHTLQAGHQVNAFLLQRWLSMYSPQVAWLVNETGNMQWQSMTDPQEWYDYYFTLVPRMHFKRIKYIKKAPKEKSKHHNEIALLAEYMQISQREATAYIKQDPSLLDTLKNDKDGVYKKTRVASE